LSHDDEEVLTMKEFLKYKKMIQLIKKYDIEEDELEEMLEKHKFDNKSIEEIIYSLEIEGRLMDLF